MAREGFKALAAEGIVPRHVITDGDSATFKAAEDVYFSGHSHVEPVQQLDPPHVNRSVRKHVAATPDLPSCIFQVCATKEEHKINLRKLAADLTKRLQGEHAAAHARYHGDTERVAEHVERLRPCLVKCYQGNHELCRSSSLMCKNGTWSCKATYGIQDYKGLILDVESEHVFNLFIQRRLGHAILEKTKHLMTSQKCEASNRALSTSLPKHVTFSRNFVPRAQATVKRVNRGPGQAVYDQNRFIGASLPSGSDAVKMLFHLQKKSASDRARCKTSASKCKRHLRGKRLRRLHDEKRATRAYRSEMVLEAVQKHSVLKKHNYSKDKQFVKC